MDSSASPLSLFCIFVLMSQISKKYSDYLKSRSWKEKRREVLVRDCFKCVDCGAKSSLDVHHLHYRNIFNERLEDLITVCRACHDKRHGLRTDCNQVHVAVPKSSVSLPYWKKPKKKGYNLHDGTKEELLEKLRKAENTLFNIQKKYDPKRDAYWKYSKRVESLNRKIMGIKKSIDIIG